MAVNDVFRVALVGGLNGQEIVNVFHYQQTTGNTSGLSDIESLVRAFNVSTPLTVAAAQSQDAQYGVIEGRSFIPPGGPMVGFDLPITLTGAIAEDSCPPTVAVVIRKKTAFLGRKYRGRNFFAAIPVTAINAGQIAAGSLGGWEDIRDQMASPLAWTVSGSPTFEPVIAALDGSVIVAPIGVRATRINICVVDPILRSQRRREIGVGS